MQPTTLLTGAVRPLPLPVVVERWEPRIDRTSPRRCFRARLTDVDAQSWTFFPIFHVRLCRRHAAASFRLTRVGGLWPQIEDPGPTYPARLATRCELASSGRSNCVSVLGLVTTLAVHSRSYLRTTDGPCPKSPCVAEHLELSVRPHPHRLCGVAWTLFLSAAVTVAPIGSRCVRVDLAGSTKPLPASAV